MIPYFEDVCSRDDNYVSIRLDQGAISEPQLEPTIDGTLTTVVKGKRKIIRQDTRMIRNRIRIYMHEVGEAGKKRTKGDSEVFLRMWNMKRELPHMATRG